VKIRDNFEKLEDYVIVVTRIIIHV